MARIKKQLFINGKSYWVSANSEAEMIEKLSQMLESGSNFKAEPSGPLFKEYALEWYELYCKPKLKLTTARCVDSYMRCYLLPGFGKLRMSKITPKHVQTFLLDHQELAKRTLKDILMWLRQILDFAVEDGYLSFNPAKSRRIANPSRKETKREALDEADFQDILRQLPQMQPLDASLITLAMFTGMRRGEILGLKHKDIDLKNGFIHVRRSATYPNQNRAIVADPKTAAGIRDIPILHQLMPWLPKEGNPEAFIFQSEEDEMEPLSHQQFVNTWNRITKNVDLHGATLHVLRHTFCTIANNCGMDIKTRQALAGHADIRITLNRYTHSQPEQVKRETQKMEAWLENLGTLPETADGSKPA